MVAWSNIQSDSTAKQITLKIKTSLAIFFENWLIDYFKAKAFCIVKTIVFVNFIRNLIKFNILLFTGVTIILILVAV